MAVGRFFGLILGDNLSGTDNGDGTITLDVAAAGSDGWVADTDETWTRTGNQTFTVPGDQTAKFYKYAKLKWTQTTVKYGNVLSSSHASETTTVTIVANTDYVLTAAAISANYHSYADSPQGWPGWFNYTITWTGFTATVPTMSQAQYDIVGRVCHVRLRMSGSGVSNATTLTFTVPIACSGEEFTMISPVQDNGVNLATAGRMQLTSGSAVVTVGKDLQGGAWTNSGNKGLQGSFFYGI